MTVEQLVEQAAERLVQYLRSRDDRSLPVVDFADPDGLARRFAAGGVGLPVMAPQPPRAPEQLLATIERILAASVRTQHPRFFNQNFAGADPVAVIADWLIAAVNTTAATFEAAPVFTLIERECVTRAAQVMGFAADGRGYDGVFGPGGSLNNILALHLARHHRFPETAVGGNGLMPQVAVFTSAQAHYSLRKAVTLLGLGRDALVSVACDARGAMRPDALVTAVADARGAGRFPLMVNATAGTTVLGAFDPLPAIADIARDAGMWLHVDGCHGASVAFSRTHRHLVAGLERADSLAWNPHKMLGITQQCSLLLVHHRELLHQALASGAEYLFQTDKNHADLDTGDKTVLCARRPDAFKLWSTWKLRGDSGFEARIDRVFALAHHAHRKLLAEQDRAPEERRFVWAAPPSFTHVCFWWVPPALRPFDPERADAETLGLLHRVAPAIKNRMQREGSLMVGYQPLGERPNFFRLLVINPAVTEADIDAVFADIDRHGRDCVRAASG